MAFPDGWNRKQKITIQSSQVSGSGTHSNFPALITLIHLEIREIMAVMRKQWNDGQWFEYRDGTPEGAAEYVTTNQFRIVGSDATAYYHIGRRVKIVGGSGTIFASITAVSFGSGATTVTVDQTLTNETITVYTSILSASNHALPFETVQDIVGAMFNGNTETGIEATYQGSDGTIDFVVTATDNNFTDAYKSQLDANTATFTTAKDSKLSGVATGADVTSANTSAACSGNAASASYAAAVTTAARNSTNATHYPLFATGQSGNLPPYTDNGLTYNPATGVMQSVDYTVTSDVRLKDNIQNIQSPFATVMKLRPVTHTWNDRDDGVCHDGLIAQEVREIKPELVHENVDTGILSVNYQKIIPSLIACIQELHKRVKELENARI